MGFSEARGTLWLQILPVPGWEDAIYPAFAHEYYHAVNHPDDLTQSSTLLDYLVNEGGADSFTAILYPDFVPSWTRAITPEQQRALWPLLEPQLSSRNPATIDRFMFGDGETVPLQAGYTIGFEIVQAYLDRHPDAEIADWSRLDAREILEGSGYDPASD